jgi:SPP1 family predicted phage head-tail adaptor
MLNAGKYKRVIAIVQSQKTTDADGFPIYADKHILTTHAAVKTTRGYTLIAAGTDFEAAYTNFTIRYPKTPVTRDMHVLYAGKRYCICYLNNVDEAGVELEIQAKEITK